MKTRLPRRFHPHVELLEGRWLPSPVLTSSLNWAGYADTAGAGAVTQVVGKWVVPVVAGTNSGYASAWVGIDGFSSSSVEQIGTDSDYTNGPQYYAWWEMYPNPSVTIPSLTIRPGDVMSASVTYQGSDRFTLSISDTTSAQSFTTTQTLAGAQRSSAEWIQEAPSSVSGILPLANFGTINFSGGQATLGGNTGPIDNNWAGATAYQINMVTQKGSLKASTSGLADSVGSPAASSFSVTWVSSGSGNGHGHGHGPNSPQIDPTLMAAAGMIAPGGGGPTAAAPVASAVVAPAAGSPLAAALLTPPAVGGGALGFSARWVGGGDPDRAAFIEAAGPDLLPVPAEADAPGDSSAAPADSSTPGSTPSPVSRPGIDLGPVPDPDAFWAEWRREPATASESVPAAVEATGSERGGVALAGLALAFGLGLPWDTRGRRAVRRPPHAGS
jgi:hypothetical protein